MIKWFFRFLRLFNKGLPTELEVAYCYFKLLDTGVHISSKIIEAMDYYADGLSLEQIAKQMNCTRERIRQHILKGCRRAYESKAERADY